jgi:hypothetical protein
MICSHLLSFDNSNNFPRSKCIYIEGNRRKLIYNLDFDADRSRVMSFIFRSKIVILFLTGSKRVNLRHASTPYAGFLAGPDCPRKILVSYVSLPPMSSSRTIRTSNSKGRSDKDRRHTRVLSDALSGLKVDVMIYRCKRHRCRYETDEYKRRAGVEYMDENKNRTLIISSV